jgi:hypothetical protein
MPTPRPLHEIRLLFAAAAEGSQRVSLTDGEGHAIGVDQSFTPFLSDADYEKLRWYLEEYMELPDGGAVVRATRIEAELAGWGHRLHDAIFSAPDNRAALDVLLAAPEPRELTIASSDANLLRLPWELMADAAGKLALRVSLRRQLTVPKELIAGTTKLPLRILYLVSRPEDTGFLDPRLTTKALLAAIEFLQQQQVLLVWDNFESTLPQFNDAASPYTDDERHRLAELFADLTRGPGRGARHLPPRRDRPARRAPPRAARSGASRQPVAARRNTAAPPPETQRPPLQP